jgi:UDP-N-acetylmuramoyl-tripeptide--D-alanyl-D-alanine ligase
MIAMTLREIADVVGGHVDGDPDVQVTGAASVDSREVVPGGLFVALPGENFDGHSYASTAVSAGAAAVLGSRPTGAPTVVVEDPVHGLGRLAAHVVDNLTQTTVIALTGSQGKTGTKDYLEQVLGGTAPTVATAGNHNNEIGVPLTILKATRETRYLVLEMGARGIGHVAYLCGIAHPTVAAVLNVGSAHVGEFGSREAIAIAKGEIIETLPTGGVAVLNADDPFTREMGVRTAAHVMTFGVAGDVTWTEVSYDGFDRPTATFVYAGQALTTSLRLAGEHQLSNAAAAAALALSAGVTFPNIVAVLGAAVGQSKWRMQLHESAEGAVIINDAYNASPESMHAAVDTLTRIGHRRSARTIAVLGEMRELGAEQSQAHVEVGEYVAEHGVDVLLAVGEVARTMLVGVTSRQGASTTGVYAADQTVALGWLRTNMKAGDVVVVKASRGAELEKLAEILVEENP